MPGMKFVAACVACIGIAFAADKPAFEVASIKATDPNPANTAFIGMTADGARVKYRTSRCATASAGLFACGIFR